MKPLRVVLLGLLPIPTLVVACGARTGLGVDVPADASVLPFDATTQDSADVRVEDAAIQDSPQVVDTSALDSAVLPDATPGDAGSPVPSIAIGSYGTCVVQSTGVLKCFGNNAKTATAIGGLDGPVVGVRVGGGVFARIQTDELETWGNGAYFILGLGGDGGFVATPTPVSALGYSVVAAASTVQHSCAALVDGGVACWGIESTGELGDGQSSGTRTLPQPVVGLGGSAVAVATGNDFTCALLSNGKVQCWGSNYLGQVGDGTGNNNTSPTDVLGITDAVAISAGALHACALRSTGTVRCWGNDGFGELGDGVVPDGGDNYDLAPVDVAGLSGVTAITAGGFSSCALLTNGTVQCWGRNGLGQLGDGTQIDRASPVSVQGISNAIAVAIGTINACALSSTGAAKCWGSGNVGNPNAANPSLTPVDVIGLP